ncbi:hypothetical protein TNCT_228981 [Trichonephila clavata]|uniref:Uncharacterized protein n=1 Tax=Trichonephila clavata TaxID=2740835 RepID=A0A8X6LM72_TRICU|nr:hypothetical protein TNCT_228981 [Trichonephila clavata]
MNGFNEWDFSYLTKNHDIDRILFPRLEIAEKQNLHINYFNNIHLLKGFLDKIFFFISSNFLWDNLLQ